MVTRVALDTSMLMAPVQADVRVFDELDRLLVAPELLVPRSVVEELDALSSSGGQEGQAASVGRDLVERCAVVETTQSYADDAVLALALQGRVDYVATNDRALAERVLGRSVPVIGLRGGHKLAVTQP